MDRKLKVAPSMGCCDLLNLKKQVEFIDQRADYLHMDIKDGYYVRTFGIGPDFMNAIKEIVNKPMDAHLMVQRPWDYLEPCAAAGATYITPHTDVIENVALVTINRIKELGCKAGVALNPATPLESIRYYLPYLDKVTIMLVDAGIAGQAVIPEMYEKIRTLAKWRAELDLDFLIEADESMNKDLYGELYQAGADIVVLGPPALWNKHENLEQAWETMENELKNETKNITV
ncbi:allulose-6-phosphate 3-epimerase [Amphibacillus sp. Q70]|uniref:allulose-6-phosphate 3-epimerase n=1 Tax=Amphibacillus sp. Q70 TaxID=3453416 RepID=UPI003F876BA3